MSVEPKIVDDFDADSLDLRIWGPVYS